MKKSVLITNALIMAGSVLTPLIIAVVKKKDAAGIAIGVGLGFLIGSVIVGVISAFQIKLPAETETPEPTV